MKQLGESVDKIWNSRRKSYFNIQKLSSLVYGILFYLLLILGF